MMLTPRTEGYWRTFGEWLNAVCEIIGRDPVCRSMIAEFDPKEQWVRGPRTFSGGLHVFALKKLDKLPLTPYN